MELMREYNDDLNMAKNNMAMAIPTKSLAWSIEICLKIKSKAPTIIVITVAAPITVVEAIIINVSVKIIRDGRLNGANPHGDWDPSPRINETGVGIGVPAPWGSAKSSPN
ncbi:hypothetical protein PIB30_043930 [Stylosanthes scabra]|uniref:Uncharacterized protein n=1 Tax=Stylosanthes scabra TaxID=79078 RepID=A0ABU6XFY7_9FABA|nr:hypothetical protein [Stylosanthes scabra]